MSAAIIFDERMDMMKNVVARVGRLLSLQMDWYNVRLSSCTLIFLADSGPPFDQTNSSRTTTHRGAWN